MVTFSLPKVLFLSVWLVRVVFSMVYTILPLHLERMGISVAMIGVITGIYGYAAFAMDMTSAVFIDHFRKQTMIKIGLVGILWFCVGYCIESTSVVYFAFLQILLGLSLGVFRPASTALTVELAGTKKAGSALGLYNMAYILGGCCGPLIATLIVKFVSYQGLFITASSVVFIIIISLQINFNRKDEILRPRLHVMEHMQGLRRLLLDSKIYFPMMFMLIDTLILRMWMTYLPIFGNDQLDISVIQIGTIMSIESIAYVITQPLWGKVVDRGSLKFALLVGLLSPALIALTPIAKTFYFLLFIYALMGLFNSAAYVGYTKLAIQFSGDNDRGKVMSLMSASSDIGHIVGPLLGALVIKGFGKTEYLFYLPGFICLILGLFIVMRFRSISPSYE